MLRTAVTIWFALTAVLGPALCCCPKVTAQTTATPAKKKHSCCQTPCDDARPAKPAPADNCPCPMRTGVIEFTAVERTTADDAAGSQPIAFVATLEEWPAQTTGVRSHANPDDGPPVGARALLARLQILRC